MSYYPSTIIIDVMAHGYEDLVESDFTIRLYKNGVVSAVDVTITEISNGEYRVSFTPDSTTDATWSIKIFETARPHIIHKMSYRIIERPTAAEVVQLAKDMLEGNLTYNEDTEEITIFAEDNTTPIYQGTTDFRTYRTKA